MADSLFETVRAMPKIELHRHLEGSLRLDTMVEIARKHKFEMPEYSVEGLRPLVQMMPGEPRTWQNFLAKFRAIREFFLSPDVIQRITREAVIDAADDNVNYMELRFTPKALCNLVKWSFHDAVSLVCDTVAETAAEYDIDVRLIVSINRHESIEIGEETTRAAIDHRDRGVVGLDLCGMETGHPAYPFRGQFKEAREAGLRITLHAGEWEGPESVWDALSNIGAERIGHGVRAIEDHGIINVLKGLGIVLEVCPTSNVDSGVVADIRSHPLPRLIANGVKTTLNTDDPVVSGIQLSDELYRVVKYMSLTIDDVKQQVLMAAQSAFLPEDEKAALVAKFEGWLYPEAEPQKPHIDA